MALRFPNPALLCLYFIGGATVGLAQSHPSENWIATWATAQQLAPTTPEVPALAPGVKMPDFGAMKGPKPSHVEPKIADHQTIRMIVHTSVGGRTLRVELANAFGHETVSIGSARVALRTTGSSVDLHSDRQLTFSGSKTFDLPPGVVLVSDPVDLTIQPMSDLAVSLLVVKGGSSPTNHMIGLHTSYLADGDQTGHDTLTKSSTTTSYVWLRSVDVVASNRDFAIACLGDSITDGYGTTNDANQAWPTLLAKRLASQGTGPHISVLNEGISGNEVLRDGAGASALARLDRDVFSEPGVRWIVLLEGINDINLHGQITGPEGLAADDLIRGYKQIIARAHMHHVKIAGATLTPEEGVWLAGPVGEATRETVNQWIRSSGAFDTVIDFDAIVRDKDHPAKIREDLDPGDHIHPNDRGNAAMADALPLSTFIEQ